MSYILMPSYMSKFRCIGGQCKQNCCSWNWIISVDQRTANQYQELNHKELSPLFEKYIKTKPGVNGFFIEQLPNGGCPFFSPEGLCKIQQQLGFRKLSSICNTYPRYINQVEDLLEMSGEVSCPEINRLALLNPDPISFEKLTAEDYIDSDANYVLSNEIIPRNMKTKWQQFTLKLRDFSIRVLQERSNSLEERLIFLGLFYKKVQEYIDNSEINQIEELIEKYLRMLENDAAIGLGDRIHSHLPLKLEIILEACTVNANSREDYSALFWKVLKGIKFIPEKSLVVNGASYNQVYREYYLPFMDKKSYIFENYLVNYVFQKVFPFSETDNVFDSYANLIILYVLFQFHFIGLAGFMENLNDETITQTFAVYSRCIEHEYQQATLKSIMNSLRDNNSYTLPHLIVLMKN